MPLRAVIYMRKSSDDPNTYSFEFQEKDCLQFAAKQGASVVAQLKEQGISGHDTLDEREVLHTARQMLRRGEANMLIVWRFDRLARDFLDQMFVLREAHMVGASVESATEPLPKGALGFIMQSVKAGYSEEEWHGIKERLMAGRYTRAEKGFYSVGSKPPYGYRHSDEVVERKKKTYLVVDPETGPIITQMFEWAAEGVSTNEIAQRLTNQGIPSPKGRVFWQESTVARLLKRRLYIGDARAFATQEVESFEPDPASGELRRRWTRVPVEGIELPEGTVPALVSEETFEKARAHIRRNHKATLSGRVSNREDFLLRGGFAFCVTCGKAMHARSFPESQKRLPMYLCNTSTSDLLNPNDPTVQKHGVGIGAKVLDDFVWRSFIAAAREPGVVSRAVELLDSRRDDQTLHQLEVEQANLDENLRHQRGLMGMAAAVADNEIQAARVNHDLKELGGHEKGIRARMATLQQRDAVLAAAREALTNFAALSSEELEALDFDTKRRLLFDFNVRVHVHPSMRVKYVPAEERCKLVVGILESLSAEGRPIICSTATTLAMRARS